MNDLYSLLSDLIAYPSITPKDKGCQQFIKNFLTDLGFRIHQFDKPPVSNFYAEFGTQGTCIVFAGHTDVVATGDINQWHSPPFEATLKNGQVFGRGSADMKGSVAAMLLATKNLLQQQPKIKGRLGFLITSAEEGDQFDLGTPYVMEQLQKLNISMDYCIVGEPSSTHRVGDVIKIGRRGSLSASVSIIGKQGHVAYPHLAEKPYS